MTIMITMWMFLGVFVVFGLWKHSRFLNYLRDNHRAVWESLGSPSLILNNSILNGLKTQKFIFTRAYRKQNDINLTKAGNFLLGYLIFYLLYFASFIVLFFYVGLRTKA